LEPLLKIENLNITSKHNNVEHTMFNGFSVVLHNNEALAVLSDQITSRALLGLALINALPDETQINDGNVFLYHQSSPTALIKKGHIIKKQFKKNKQDIAFLSDIKSSFSPFHSIGSQLAQAIKKTSPQKTDDAKLQAVRLMQKMEIEDAADVYKLKPNRAGQEALYKISIARLITQEPLIVIADEPGENLDITVRTSFYKMLRSTQKDMKFSLLYLTSCPQAALEVADRAAVMERHKITEVFTRKEILENVQIRESFFSL
jgi:ABC-type glutathione transport system ATPase component